MDIISSVQQRTPTKRSSCKPNKNKNRNKSKPIKVVYISNPMKVNTSASQFRALVQQLTGQYAESPPDPSRFQEPHEGGGGGNHHHHTVVVPAPPMDPDQGLLLPPGGGGGGGSNSSSSMFETLEPFDDGDVFTPLMVENISALLPASVFYQVDNHW